MKIDLSRYSSGEENLKRLEPDEIRPYLGGLNRRLTELSTILAGEGHDFVSRYIAIVQETVHCLQLKHELEGEDRLDFSLTIDPSDSGFPTVRDFYFLEKDRVKAEPALSALPPREEIIETIRDQVLRGRPPTNGQVLLKRHNYYTKVKETNLLREYYLDNPKYAGQEGRKRFYILEWSCIERGSNVPVFYRM
jgi:hypothetical protein